MDKKSGKNKLVSGSTYMSFFNPIFIKEHERFSYRSKSKGNMYLDLIALSKASYEVPHVVKRVKESLYVDDEGKFLFDLKLNGKTKGVIKKEENRMKSGLDFLKRLFVTHLKTDYIFGDFGERKELKLDSSIKNKNTPLEEKTYTGENFLMFLNFLDLIPSKFFYRLPESHQERIEHFVNKINSEKISRDRKSTRLNSSHIPLSRMPSSA